MSGSDDDERSVPPDGNDRFWRELDTLLATTPAGAPLRRFPALGPAPSPVPADVLRGTVDAPPFDSPREHLAELAASTALRAVVQILQDLAIGMLRSQLEEGGSTEVVAMALGRELGVRSSTIEELQTATHTSRKRLGDRTRASLAAGRTLPFIELCRRFHLRVGAAHALAIVVGARSFEPLGRLLGLLSGVGPRVHVTRSVVARLVGPDPDQAAYVLTSLTPGGLLERHGLIVTSGSGMDGDLDVDPVVVSYLRGDPDPLSPGCSLRTSFLTYEELWLAENTRAFFDQALSVGRGAFEPGAVIVRGRVGSGRHTLAAALSSQVGRRLTVIDASSLGGDDPAEALTRELLRAELRNTTPCVERLERAVRHHGEIWRERLARVIETHPGLVFVIALPEDDLRIDQRVCDGGLNALSRDQQATAWRQLVPAASEADVALLLDTFELPPGRMIGLTEAALRIEGDTVTRTIALSGNHLDAVLAPFAVQRVPPEWSEVAAPPPAIAALRKLLVWPKGRTIAALVWGPSGAGKSFVARALVSPRVSATVDVPWLLSGSPVEIVGRIEQVFHELDGSRRALLLERLDVGIRGVDPEIVRRFAYQVWRLKAPVIATAEEPSLPWPLDRVCEDARWLPNNRLRRAAAWRHHLAGKASDELCDDAALMPATMRQIARAAECLTTERPTLKQIDEALGTLGLVRWYDDNE